MLSLYVVINHVFIIVLLLLSYYLVSKLCCICLDIDDSN